MSLFRGGEANLELPLDLRQRLRDFQHRVWWIKTAEGVCSGLVGIVCSFLLVFLLDRFWDTPPWLRLAVLLIGVSGILLLAPIKLRRWVWRVRKLPDVARLLRFKHPGLSDRLLGIVELSQGTQTTDASPALCRAAIGQVAQDTRDHDFRASVPSPRHRIWGCGAAIASAIGLTALLIPGAGLNALQRWTMPWADVPRYTFTQLERLPAKMVVPLAEPFTLSARLATRTVWSPPTGSARFGRQVELNANLQEGRYRFELPPLKTPTNITIAVGDARRRIQIVPTTRPELTSLLADIELPKYLGHSKQQKDVRGGSVSILEGSQAVFHVTASRQLANAALNGQQSDIVLDGQRIVTPRIQVTESTSQEFSWTDIDGLSAREPFQLNIRSFQDMPPILLCRNLPHEKVMLEGEVLSFDVLAEDDFGVRRVGIEWSGVEDAARTEPHRGEYLLRWGGPRKKELDAKGTFAAQSLRIEPQPIDLRVFAEDFLPGRQRVYSSVHRLYVLGAEQHMIWLTDKLKDWQRQALEVRDEERRLFERNKELRDMSPGDLDRDATRRDIANQASAERANARRLDSLAISGDDLIEQAARNSQFNVATLEKWAQTLVILKSLAGKRMPSVASLLGQASSAPSGSAGPLAQSPQVIDVESGMRTDPEKQSPEGTQGEGNPSKTVGRLGLPSTVISDSQPTEPSQSQSRSVDQKMDEAVEEQRQLLDEFDRVMDDLAKILQELFGSTFVKRLKHAARQELQLASTLHNRLESTFGRDASALDESERSLLWQLNEQQNRTADDVSLIESDLAAYYERTQEPQFNQVFAEMNETQVVSNFRKLSETISGNLAGQSIAEAEYWSDQLDRWADMLVGPG